jgi:thiamine kinase-like enzyme
MSRGLRVGTLELAIPKEAMLASSGVLSPTPGCLTHGDLHGGNIVIDQSGRPYFIDFQNAGLAPRLIDFAALQATVRFNHANRLFLTNLQGSARRPNDEEFQGVMKSVVDETKYLRRLMTGEVPVPSDHTPEWLPFSAELDRLMLANFGDATSEEILWTYWAYALSLFRFSKMEWYRKARLLAWLSALTKALDV